MKTTSKQWLAMSDEQRHTKLEQARALNSRRWQLTA